MNSLALSSPKKILTVFLIQNRCLQEITKKRLLDVDVSQSINEKKLKNLNKNKSPGVDGIHPSLLRELSKQLNGPLSILFRRTLDEGTVPADWREANVTPLYKKGIKVLLVIIDQ